ncbi:MAG: acetylxylan esterase [Armatimonadetes bacterium]|nr:acetylxylan esterase [Armatimonadota bacterium]
MNVETYQHINLATAMPDRQFDTLEFSRALYAQTTPSLGFRATTRAEAEAWQERLSAQLERLLGGFPSVRCPLRPEVVARREFRGYTRETIHFQSRENLSVFAYFLLPREFSRPGPCMICIPGHGRGVDDIVGIREDGGQREDPDGYQHDFALQALRQGFAALAVEPLGFGHRRDPTARMHGAGATSCQPAAGAALLFDQCMVGWRVWDVIRSVDYLQTRPEVDPQRIGLMGISGGGTITLFGMALEPRLKACLISGYFSTFRDSIMSLSHCVDNYIPGILQYAEMWDVAGLIAPRPLFVESGHEDPIFPEAATRYAFEQAGRIWRVWDAADRLGLEVFEGEHVFSGRQGWPFLRRWL